jgi:hypothetical protein
MGIRWFNVFRKVKPIQAYGFWVDSFGSEDKVFIPDTLPYKYVIDIFCDLISLSKVFYKKTWMTHSVQTYYELHFKEKFPLNQRSERLLKTLLRIMSESSKEKDFFKWYRSMSQLISAIY